MTEMLMMSGTEQVPEYLVLAQSADGSCVLGARPVLVVGPTQSLVGFRIRVAPMACLGHGDLSKQSSASEIQAAFPHVKFEKIDDDRGSLHLLLKVNRSLIQADELKAWIEQGEPVKMITEWLSKHLGQAKLMVEHKVFAPFLTARLVQQVDDALAVLTSEQPVESTSTSTIIDSLKSMIQGGETKVYTTDEMEQEIKKAKKAGFFVVAPGKKNNKLN